MKRFLRFALLGIGALMLILLLPLFGVVLACRPFADVAPASTSEAASSPETAAAQQIIAALEGYTRLEDQTYLTVPEWYIVYSADEYGAFITERVPSRFPYFRAIGQYWGSYYDVCAITREQYAFNSGYHLTLAVIGISFTVENIFKGLYENSVGRITEWLSSAELTPEDAFAAQVAQEYGAFIHTIPWYEFPFEARLRTLWVETSWWGPNVLRKWERKFALTLEYGGKALYGGLIRQGTQAAYGAEDLEIQAWVTGVTDELLQQHPDVNIVAPIADDSAVVKIPRYEAFTQLVPKVTADGLQFAEIAGNDEIALTLLAPHDWRYDLPVGELLFEMPILSQPTEKRLVIRTPVSSLHRLLAALAGTDIQLEHIYDY